MPMPGSSDRPRRKEERVLVGIIHYNVTKNKKCLLVKKNDFKNQMFNLITIKVPIPLKLQSNKI